MAEIQEVTATEKAEGKTVTLTLDELQKMVAEQVAQAVALREGASDRINTKTAETFREEQKEYKKMVYKYCDEDHIDKLVDFVEKFNSKKYREKDWNVRAWKAVNVVGTNGKGKACRVKGRLGWVKCSFAQIGGRMVVGFSGKPTFAFAERLQNKGFRLTDDCTFVGKMDSAKFIDLLPSYVTDIYNIQLANKK